MLEFSEQESSGILELSQREGCTPFMILMSALVITLQKLTGQDDMVIGTVAAGRTRSELENVIGCFMNFLPVRLRIIGSNTCQELLASVKEAVLESQAHQDCPFEKIVEAINPERRENRNPLYNVALLLQDYSENYFESNGIRSEAYPLSLETAMLDLRFEAVQTGSELVLNCEYRRD